MAIATTSAHVSRALEFFHKEGKYFSIGKTSPWGGETDTPTPPNISDYKLEELVALKKVDNTYLVVQDDTAGTISYRDTKWRIVTPEVKTTTSSQVPSGATVVPLTSLAGINKGNKLRINNTYESIIIDVQTVNNSVVLEVPAPSDIPANSEVLGGAYVEGAKHVYVNCTLNYDQFPIVTYRQVGLQTSVVPLTGIADTSTLRSAKYSPSGLDEYSSLGNLEIIDNRAPTVREADQRESIGLIIEF